MDFQRNNYTAAGTLIAAAGRLTHRQVLKAARRYVAEFHRGARCGFLPATAAQTRPAVRLCRKKTEQTQIAFGVRACSRHHESRFALRLLNAVLGENMSSRLFQTVRRDQGLAYSIYSANSYFDRHGRPRDLGGPGFGESGKDPWNYFARVEAAAGETGAGG